MATSNPFEGEIYGDSDSEEKGGKSEENANKDGNKTQVEEQKVDPQADTKGARNPAEKAESETKKFEYPLQKFNRLKDDVLDLEKQLKELVQMAESNNEEPTKRIVAQVSEDIKRKWGNAEQFTNNPYLMPLFGEAQASITGTVDSKYLLKRLQEFEINSTANKNMKAHPPQSQQSQSQSQQSQQSQSQSQTQESSLSASLTLFHEGSVDSRSYRLNEIALRLQTLETLVGPTPENMSNSKGGMIQSMDYLSNRLELLCDQNRLSALKRRADALKTALKDIKSVTQNTMGDQITKSKEHRINQMSEIMEKWDQASQDLPAIINKLKALQGSHQDTADMLRKVTVLGNRHRQIEETLNASSHLLQQVNDNLAENAKTIEGNTRSVETRIAQLQQQLQNLK